MSPDPTPFAAGSTRGRIYRFVSWRSEECRVEEDDRCRGTTDTERVAVAAVLDAIAGAPAPKPMWLSTVITDPNAGPAGLTAEPPEAGPGSGPAVSAQPFFLYDTPCSTDVATLPSGNHATHDTGRDGATCSGLTPPDLMGPTAPVTPAEGCPAPRHDYSSEVPGSAAAGIVLRRPLSGCPTSYAATGDRTTVHRWATAPLTSAFATPPTGARTAMHLWTRTADGAAGGATICMRLHAESAPSVALAAGSFTPPQWPTTPTPVGFTLAHGSFTVPSAGRLVLTLSLQAGSDRDVELRFDRPDDRSFVSIATTPLPGARPGEARVAARSGRGPHVAVKRCTSNYSIRHEARADRSVPW